MGSFLRAQAYGLKQCACLSLGLIAIGVLSLAPGGGIADITWDAIEQIVAVSVGSVLIVHTIGKLLARV